MKSPIDHTRSSGNVFEDIGVANPEEALAKADLARQVNKIIKSRGLNQAETAKILGIDQPRVSALWRGRLRDFSLERVMEFAALLGNEVEISIRPSSHSGIKVVSAPEALTSSLERQVISNTMVGGLPMELSYIMGAISYGQSQSIKLDYSEIAAFIDCDPKRCESLAA